MRWTLGLISPDILPFATFFPAVLLAALLGGPGPGIFAATLGGILGWWAFLAPQSALLPLAPHHQIDLLLYLFSALIIVWGADHYRSLANRLADEEALRKLSVEELSHRLKNKLATIQAILRLRLRDHRELSNDVIASLDALIATDDLIMQTQSKGACIRDILFAEARPYEASRVIIDGPDVLLPPKAASVMALLVHELATNAAKYGALSSPAGEVSIRWTLAGARLDLEWQESGGPAVTVPTRHGFGTRLFSKVLEQFGGTVVADFATTGLVCKLALSVPEIAPSIAPDATVDATNKLAADRTQSRP